MLTSTIEPLVLPVSTIDRKSRPVVYNTQTPIAAPENRQELQHAIRQCEKLGHTNDNKDIYLYQHTSSSPILREIGRLREIAFRTVGEGTNRRRDIDAYDSDYYHLILWDNNDLEIVGAYRIGDAKKLVEKKKNYSGLYSSTLFNYDEKMSPFFDEALELGRSFIQPRYWGKRSLDYLWFGIGAFLKSRPQYRYLFGPVSLSNTLPEKAKALIVCFYTLYFGINEKTSKNYQGLASAKNPYNMPLITYDLFSGENYREDFIKLKGMLSNMGVAIPTLYKQYTETYEDEGIHFLDFSVDPDFNFCIDGLVLTDLSLLKEKKRRRYIPE